ncbi:YycH family regulatory protein [Bacillus dakarensis]|uniref:YycH family regulatory protein n=1 Tax=Robertmurraya dakarensis TaxID=1926278 RepID=UPI0009810924|nr:two-component system activity regulator YycH [Bacillus dakarensis]
MTYENFKTVLLTFLVLTSTLFTYGIWTYKPSYDTMENTNIVPEVNLGEKKEVSQIVKPTKIFYHQNNLHLGTVNHNEINTVLQELSNWNLDGFENVSKNIGGLSNFYEEGYAEIIFPDIVPMEIYKGVLNLRDSETLNFQFDRIIIDLKNTAGEEGFVYFLNSEHDQAFRARVVVSFINNFKQSYYQTAKDNPSFLTYTLEPLTDNRSLLVLTYSTTLPTYSYLLDIFQTDSFRDALFSDPIRVQRYSSMSGDEYKDSSTLLRVNKETYTISYVNPAEESERPINASELLQHSIDFVNGHGGWTDNYRFVGVDAAERTVSYRMYERSSGLPIFNSGMSDILHIWGQTETFMYMRNNFALDRRVDTETKENPLVSGIDTLRILKNTEGINPEFIQDLTIGYNMVRGSGGPLVHLQPAWYYKYKDQWLMVPKENKGGEEIGLE